MKFRVPAVRPRLVDRHRLSDELLEAMGTMPVVLLHAGAGFGKTTLLAQCASRAPAEWTLAWIAVDRLDRDPARLFRTLVDSIIAAIPSDHPLDADTLTRMVESGDAGSKAAMAEIVDWLAESEIERFVWVCDDIHLIDNALSWRWIDRFIDLLPPNVCWVMATRLMPPLSLARRRARGQLFEVDQAELSLSPDEAHDFVAKHVDAGSEELARQLHARTSGWVAGLQLLAAGARARGAGGRASPGALAVTPGDERVFEYLAEEVVAKLPPPLASFVSDCSVLDELEPAQCAVLTGDAGARDAIDELVRRNLFVTVVDPNGPTVRLHDLFRDFLQTRLRRADARRWSELHARAAEIAGGNPLRAARHALEAGRPGVALRTLAAHSEALLREGASGEVRELMASLSAHGAAEEPEAHWVAALLALQRNAFDDARNSLEAAWQAFDRLGDAPRAARSVILLARVLSYAGDIRAAAERIDAIDENALDEPLRAELALERAWLFSANGRPLEAARALETAIALAERVASLELCTRLAERIRSHFVGTPGFARLFTRFHDLAMGLGPRPDSVLHAHATALAAWAAIWEGERERADELLESLWVDVDRWRSFRALYVDVCVIRSVLLTLARRFGDAVECVQEIIRSGQTSVLGLRNAWVGSYLYLIARIHWSAGNGAALRQTYARLLTAYRDTEWPYMAAARRWAEALVAFEDGQHETAVALLEEVVVAQRAHPVLAMCGDVRIAAIAALAASGAPERAAALAVELLEDASRPGELGRLLVERRELVASLATKLPAAHPRRAHYAAVVARCVEITGAGRDEAALADSGTGLPTLGATRPGAAGFAGAGFMAAGLAAGPQATPGASGHATPPTIAGMDLTAREREVLALIAEGASNKRIAIRLNLSLHTVKRHVANIIGKLGVRTRGEAMARYLGTAR